MILLVHKYRTNEKGRRYGYLKSGTEKNIWV